MIRSYKFGVCYVAPGQTTEEEMFQNTMDKTSGAFKGFLEWLGDMIELKGWKGYRAGMCLRLCFCCTYTHRIAHHFP